LLNPGDAFGEMALLTDEPRSATVKALTDGAVLRLDRNEFQALMAKEPDLARALISMLAQRLRQTDRGWAERESVLVAGIEGQLGRLPADRRRRVLRAGLLDV